MQSKVVIRGGGDIASGIARRLFLAGMNVVVLELPNPRAIRRAVSFASAVHEGNVSIEGVTGRLSEAPPLERRDFIPVIVDGDGSVIDAWGPDVLIDARMRKTPQENGKLSPERFVLGIGPGFTVGVNCHAVVETMRGHSLGKVLWEGAAESNTGKPEPVCGYSTERVLRAPAAGTFSPLSEIGDPVEPGDKVAEVGSAPVLAEIGGILRGVLYPGTNVEEGDKVGDIDPRSVREYCFTVSDKANAVAGGVLEAVMIAIRRRE